MIMHYGRTLSDAEAVQLENWMSATLNVPLLPRRPPAAAFRGPARLMVLSSNHSACMLQL